MLDTYILQRPGGSTNVNATVREYRAPTDESVRLLREMEAKAAEKFLNSVPLKDNIVEGVIARHMDIFGPKLLIALKINGKRIQGSVDIECLDGSEVVIKNAVEDLGRTIAAHMLAGLSPEQQKVLFNENF